MDYNRGVRGNLKSVRRGAAMRSAIVYLSSVCPACHCEFKMPYTRLEITELLLSDHAFLLYSACHNISWPASEDDRRQLFALIKPADLLFAAQGSPSTGKRGTPAVDSNPPTTKLT